MVVWRYSSLDFILGSIPGGAGPMMEWVFVLFLWSPGTFLHRQTIFSDM